MESNYGKMTIAQLKNELERRGAKVTGRKKELIERLESYDKHSNFSGPSFELPDSVSLPDWPVSGFTSVTKNHRENIPKICKAHIEQYVLYRQGSDRQSVKDKSSLKKGALMANDSVNALSFLNHQEGKTFFSGKYNLTKLWL
jgi:hypothetical protein